ncbi:MAG TPA: malonyl-[acyl-carrier protein] O-methyltransferase BioC [Candidatus Omnitrophica bacterium]|nr:malonyl-[acyl-carrier protein] O-methyltransferase BioC [Candidatus Omnitrophota bacterium]
MDKKSVIRNFSKAARLYDEYADIQRLAAFELLSRQPRDECRNILEIGCGTGIYTSLLKEKFDKAALKAVDISAEMIRVAEGKLKGGVEFTVADAEDVLPYGNFDLITSNASMQWFADLEAALRKCSAKLMENGVLLFSIFGPQTFMELESAIKDVSKGKSVVASQFNSKEVLEAMFKRHFRKVSIDEIKYSESFTFLMELLSKIKHTGTAGTSMANNIFSGPNRLKEIEKVYKSTFGAITATYQVFFCRCEAL